MVSFSLTAPRMLEQLEPPSRWTVATIAIYAIGAILIILAGLRPIIARMRAQGGLDSKTIKRRNLLEALYRAWLIAGQTALITFGYGQWVANTLGAYHIPLLEKIVLMVPFCLIIITGWALDYRFHLAIRTINAPSGDHTPHYWSRRSHILYNIRHNLLFTIAPIGLILLLSDIVEFYVLPATPHDAQEAVYLTTSLGGALVVFLISPLLITRIWKTRSLEPGELRSDLETLCGTLKLKYRDILVWETEGVIANAAVMGLIAPFRFILMSDGILHRLERHHIKAVFAHEGGHITSKHLPYLMMMAIATMTLCATATDFAAEYFELTEISAGILMFALLLTVGGFLFGAVSRQFERQSDVIGAWASAPPEDDSPTITQEGAAIFASALQQIAVMNGINPQKRNWRHGSIAYRVQYILTLGSTGATRQPIDATVRKIKLAIIIATITAAISMAL
ncbi:MAG: M48 family metalloprotease [Phycisphaerales bacterium]|jgi:STE24 endopeptidase|nr:M48 family metalloprotease [Phycisphaerales bacterium]